MNRNRWLSVAAAITALVVGLMAYAGTASAVTPTNPDITGTGGGTYVVGVPFNYQVSASASVTTFFGYNLGVVFPSTTVGGNLTQSGAIDDSGPAWGSADACGTVLDDNLGGLLLPPLRADIIGCVALGGMSNGPTPLAHIKFTGSAVGVGAAHMISFGPPDSGGAGAGTFAIGAGSLPLADNLFCGDGGMFVAAAGYCGPLPVAGSQPWDSVFNIINPPPDLNITKVPSSNSFVAGQPESFTLTVNNPSGTTTATNVVVKDTLDAAFPGANVTFSGPNAGTCGIVGQLVTCGPTTIAPLGVWSATININPTNGASGGTSPNNCATVTLAQNDPNLANNTSCAVVQIIAPAVAWSKVNTCGNGNVWLAENNNPAQSVGQCVGTQTFDEVMTNQGDPNGLGGFSFDLHYDPTQYQPPVIDLSPAVALFAASGRTLDCSITIPQNGDIHVACASTGTLGTGPKFVGAKVMAHVTLTPQDLLVEAIRPNKENGDISVVKDDQVTVTNTCGQPLNDDTIQPVPGQDDCQGNLLQGVGPGGVLQGNPNGGELTSTIRRLEGDITKDCSVTVADMQLEASKFGMSVGDLLYNVFFDVNSPLQHGDGEIDINDIQFIYGRFGSECSNPIPAQPPQPAPGG